MTERSFDEMIAYFNRRVAGMDINPGDKMELLGMVAALGFKHEKSAPQWIPCSERLPEPNRHDALNVDVYYLAQTEFGDMIVASYNESHEGTKWWEQMYSYRIFDDEIVAWMPLPEKYKGE